MVWCCRRLCRLKIHWFPDNNFSLSESISIKFNKKVQYQKRKAGIDIGDDGPNRFGIRGPKQAFFYFQDIILCISISITLKLYHNVLYHRYKVWIDFRGYGPNSLGIWGQKRGPNKPFCSFQSITCPDNNLCLMDIWNKIRRFNIKKGRLGLILDMKVPTD